MSRWFCDSCGSLQPASGNFYDILGIPPSLSLDGTALQQRFYELSRRLHPDRFTRRSSREQELSEQATAVLNDAYRALRDPVSRAEYFLKLQGFDIGEQRNRDVPPELLEEVFELNMTLEDLRGGDASARPLLQQAHERFVAMRDSVDGELQGLFTAHDANPSPDNLAAIRSVLNRRRYIRNLILEVEKELGS